MSLALAAVREQPFPVGELLAQTLREHNVQPKFYAAMTGWDFPQLSLALRDLAPVDLRKVVKSDWPILSGFIGKVIAAHFAWWLAQVSGPLRMAKADLPERDERKVSA